MLECKEREENGGSGEEKHVDEEEEKKRRQTRWGKWQKIEGVKLRRHERGQQGGE